MEGLDFFLVRGVVDSSFFSFPLVSKERLMVEPMVRVQVIRGDLLKYSLLKNYISSRYITLEGHILVTSNFFHVWKVKTNVRKTNNVLHNREVRH